MSTVKKCQDGVYRWVYEMSLYKNPTILLTILKVFFFIGIGLWAFMIIIDLVNGDLDSEMFLGTSKVFLIVLGIFLFLGVVSYYIYALIMGGKYCVLFEMDEKGIKHSQMPKQIKKAQVIGAISVLAGMATGHPGVSFAGIVSATRTSMYSEFSKVKSVKSYPKRNLIKVNEMLNKNQVYAENEDYEFVLGFIKHYTGK